MGKNKVRVGGSKGARWAKGQSSNSNPAKNKHRTQAKSRFFNHGDAGGESKLTTAALLRHDAVQGGLKLGAGEEDDATGVTHKTFDTFASDWSGCTNVAFDKVINKFKATNAGHKDMLAVLAAVTEVIKQEGGKETETEYFAALMTTLEVTQDEEMLSAVVRLLGLVIKKVPHPVLISRYSQVTGVLQTVLSRHAASANVSLLRGLLGCISVLLRVQPAAAWQLPQTSHDFATLLSFTAHHKPKLRKAGQHAVVSVVRGSDPDLVPHPAAGQAAAHCQAVIAQSGPTENTVLYMLTMLRDILPALNKSATKSACETVLKLLTLGSSILVSTGLSALHGLFSGRPSSSCLPPEMNSQLVTALYEYQPGVNDGAPLVAWLAVQQEGILNLAQNKADLAHGHLLRFAQTCLSCLLSDRAEAVKATGLALRAVLGEAGRDMDANVAAKLTKVLGEGLCYQYHAAWPILLPVLQTLVEVMGSSQPATLSPLLISLAALRGSHGFNLEGAVDGVVGAAIAAAGPRLVLQAVPLNITAAENEDREFRSSWLLPVLRENIKNTELAFFSEYFLPLAAKCFDRSNACAAQQDLIGQKAYEALTYQMWSLLPGFCNGPTDLVVSFRSVAKTLGVQLGSRKEVRLDILTGLRHLISGNIDHPENQAVLASYAKNFLPILFNLYVAVPAGSEEAGQRLAAFETAKLFYQISDPNMVNAMFDKALQMHKGETVLFTRDAVMDLLRSMIPHIETSRIEILYKETMSRVESKDQKEQKKAYRLLEELCRGPSPAVRSFLTSALPQLRSSLLSSLSATSPSSQAPRLRCLTSILRQLEDPSEEFALALIPEAVLCIRAVNGKARSAAFTLLVAVGEALQRWNTAADSDEVISRYMASMLAGLAGNPGLIHCTVLAVSRIYFQFRDIFPEALTEQVLTNVLLLLSSSSREVAGAALSFIKVFITSTPLLMSSKFVPRIVEALVVMPDDCRRHFRVKTKFLLERLCRKFGWDFVSSLVPQSDVTLHKRLKNMRKEMAKRARTVSEDSGGDEDDVYASTKKQKTMDEILADSSDEEDDMEESKPGSKKNKKNKKSPQTWIKEGGEEVVDLLSSTASQAVSSSNPKTAKSVAEKPTKKEPFKINNDGKLIINDDSDSDNEGKSPKRSARAMANMLEDSDDDEEAETFESLVSGKRRKTGSSDVGSQKSAMSGVQSTKSTFSKYEPSGTGIHRKVEKEKDSGSEYRNKSGKGDVKRKGKHDPYAYIPLTHHALNKRKQSKAKGQFSSVLNAAKKGAKKGHKSNVREMKSLMKNMKV